MPHDVYAPPRALGLAAVPPESADRLRNRSFMLLGISILAAFGGGITSAVVDSRALAFLTGAGAALMALGGTGLALVAIVRSRGVGAVLGSICAFVMNLGMTGIGLLVAWFSTMTFTRGRQLRRFGNVLLPPVAASTAANDWTEPTVDPEEIDFRDVLAGDDVDDETRAALAGQWRENGRTEHASVAAFARLTLDLMALGAPPHLIAAAQRDALDEIRHAELCFALGRAIDGSNESPAAFPAAARARTLSRVRSVALAELAVDSLIDGALHEGVSARIVAKLARRAVDPSIRAILKQIAADEGRHSAHGWDVVKFCLEEGGAPVAHALASAVSVLPDSMETPLPDDAAFGGWERWGIMGAALERNEYVSARAALVRRVAMLVRVYGVTDAA